MVVDVCVATSVYVGRVVMVGVGVGTVAVNVGVNVGIIVTTGVSVGTGVGVGNMVGGKTPPGVPYPGCRNCSLIISECALSVMYGTIMFMSGVIIGWLKTTSTATRAFGPPGYSVPWTGGSEA